jgi:hypothetical protein
MIKMQSILDLYIGMKGISLVIRTLSCYRFFYMTYELMDEDSRRQQNPEKRKE